MNSIFKKKTKPLSAKQIASYFIEKSDSESENDLTNLKLQKILYFSQAEFYVQNHEALFSDSIEAWELGPVVNGVYQWLKGCGAYPISSFDVKLDYDEIPRSIKEFLDMIWENYSKYSASFLVDRTHDPNGPWFEAFNKHQNTIINLTQLDKVKLQNEW